MVAPLARVTGLARPNTAPLALGAIAAGALVLTASADDGVVLCPFRRCTGGYCPGCGATRAANRLIHGDLHASWAHHPWVLLAAIQLIGLGAVAALIRPAIRPVWIRRAAVPLLTVNCVVLIGIWAVRRSANVIPVGWL